VVDTVGDEEPCINPRPGVTDQDRSGSSDLTIVTLVLQQMTLLESRLMRRLDEHAQLLAGRWDSHEREHADLDERLKEQGELIGTHLKAEEKEHIEFDARVKPVVSIAGIIKREWRTITIIALIVLDGVARARTELGI
jgi:hypothetical protein